MLCLLIEMNSCGAEIKATQSTQISSIKVNLICIVDKH